MKLIKPSYKICLQEDYTLEGIYKQIERAARVCYKSEDKIKEDSAKKMVNALIKSEHYAMLEHGTVYLKIAENHPDYDTMYARWCDDPFSKFKLDSNDTIYITTNYRRIIEADREDDLEYLCEPTEYHERRVTVHFICDMGVAREFCRHRVFSFAQESTRYCNYIKDKFENELTFIKPLWCNILEGNYPCHLDHKTAIFTSEGWTFESKEIHGADKLFLMNLGIVEHDYKILIEQGWKPEEARNILPLALKTELVMTGFASDWKHFFDLRALGTTGRPHPQAKELAEPLMHEFKNNNWL